MPEYALIRTSLVSLSIHLAFALVAVVLGALVIKFIDRFLLKKLDLEEVAILFADSAALDSLAVIVSHESLHLFGAPDLYRVTPRDRADAHDIMNDFCLGFRETTVGDATAYAVGWEPAPPQRRYPIRDR